MQGYTDFAKIWKTSQNPIRQILTLKSFHPQDPQLLNAVVKHFVAGDVAYRNFVAVDKAYRNF
jgi:hypothetical protein